MNWFFASVDWFFIELFPIIYNFGFLRVDSIGLRLFSWNAFEFHRLSVVSHEEGVFDSVKINGRHFLFFERFVVEIFGFTFWVNRLGSWVSTGKFIDGYEELLLLWIFSGSSCFFLIGITVGVDIDVLNFVVPGSGLGIEVEFELCYHLSVYH